MKALKYLLRAVCVACLIAMVYGGIFCACNIPIWLDGGGNLDLLFFLIGAVVLCIGVVIVLLIVGILISLFFKGIKWAWSK